MGLIIEVWYAGSTRQPDIQLVHILHRAFQVVLTACRDDISQGIDLTRNHQYGVAPVTKCHLTG